MAKRDPSQSVRDTFRRTVAHHGLLRNGDRVLVAFSGGADSSALLALLLEMREAWRLDIHLAHFNHRLRRAADGDERAVRKTALRLGLPLHVGSADVRAISRRRRLNLEEAARFLRYDFLLKTARRIKATRIATGHTLNDQAETLLMRLLRGSGAAGLAGIIPELAGLIIRPLLDLEHAELVGYLKRNRWVWREDRTNRNLRLARGRLRQRIIPYLQKNFDASALRALGRSASIALEENRVLNDMAAAEYEKAVLFKESGAGLSFKALQAMPLALARRCVRFFIAGVKGTLRDVSFEDVERLRELGEGKEVGLGQGLVFRREAGVLLPGPKPSPQRAFRYLWDGRKSLAVKEAGLTFRIKPLASVKGRRLDFDDSRRAYLDAAALRFPLEVRNRCEGDRYRPLGAPGTKKLKEIMRSKGIPLTERDSRPVFVSGGRIAWVLGLPVAEEFKAWRGTTKVYCLEKL